MTQVRRLTSVFVLSILFAQCVFATNETKSPTELENVFTVAVLPFSTRGEGLENIGEDLQALLTAQLSDNPEFLLVERAAIDEALSEVELGLSGNVNPDTAAQVGKIVGAHILVTGRIFPVQKELALVGKIVSTETSRVLGVTSRMPMRGSVIEASADLADKISAQLASNGRNMVAQRESKEDLVGSLSALLAGKELPTISLLIPEVSLSRPVPDPAVQTEMGLILQKLGFELVDPLASNKAPDIEITGEAFSEFGLRRGHLVSSKGRAEIKALDHSNGKVITVDRETSVAVELSPEIAGKLALEKCGQALAKRFVKAIAASLPAQKSVKAAN